MNPNPNPNLTPLKLTYYLDTEFVEGFTKSLFAKRRHFIDLISIGIVCQDRREYYAISKEFDLTYVWNNKDSWVKENVLRKIHAELYKKSREPRLREFTKHNVRTLLEKYGKTNDDIARDIFFFVNPQLTQYLIRILSGALKYEGATLQQYFKTFNDITESDKDALIASPTFVGYFADYDWVLFCSLYGRMINLPRGFPMYCYDLKQLMHDNDLDSEWKKQKCPDPAGEHNALVDARWNLNLHEMITATVNYFSSIPKE